MVRINIKITKLFVSKPIDYSFSKNDMCHGRKYKVQCIAFLNYRKRYLTYFQRIKELLRLITILLHEIFSMKIDCFILTYVILILRKNAATTSIIH